VQSESISLEPSPYQSAILLTPDEVDTIVAAGGRGGGKSFAAAFYLLRHAVTFGADSKQLYLRKSFPQLRDFESICESLFKQAVPGAEFNRHERIWRFPNGAQIEISQYESRAQSYERLVGRSFSTIIVDECGTYSALDDIDVLRSNIRARRGVECKLILLANPNGPLHGAILRRFIAGTTPWTPTLDKVTNTQFILCPSTYLQNPFIDQGKYATTLRAAAANDPMRLAAWLFGDWSGSVSGLYLDGIDFEKVRVAPFIGVPNPAFTPFVCGDYGAYYPAWYGLMLKARRDGVLPCGTRVAKGSIVVADEAHTATDHDLNLGRGLNIEDQAAIIRNMCERHGVRAFGYLDDASFNRSGGPGTPSTADLFGRCGVRFLKVHKGARLASMSAFRHALINAGTDKPGFYVSAAASYWFNTVPLLVRSEKHPDEITDHQAAHAFDGSRYALSAGEGSKATQRSFNEPRRDPFFDDDRKNAVFV
jgi:hypothetical protein